MCVCVCRLVLSEVEEFIASINRFIWISYAHTYFNENFKSEFLEFYCGMRNSYFFNIISNSSFPIIRPCDCHTHIKLWYLIKFHSCLSFNFNILLFSPSFHIIFYQQKMKNERKCIKIYRLLHYPFPTPMHLSGG